MIDLAVTTCRIKSVLPIKYVVARGGPRDDTRTEQSEEPKEIPNEVCRAACGATRRIDQGATTLIQSVFNQVCRGSLANASGSLGNDSPESFGNAPGSFGNVSKQPEEIPNQVCRGMCGTTPWLTRP